QGKKDKAVGSSKSSRVVIAFGAQKSDFSGNYLPSSAHFISKAHVEDVSEQFGLGYWVCTGSDTDSVLYLGLSTNNDGSAVNSAAGVAWAKVVNDVTSWIRTHSASSQVIVEGANDIEMSWSSYSAALAWTNGYQSATSAMYVDTASSDGCPQTTHTNGSCN